MKPTKEQIDKLWENEEWFDLTIDEKCIMCNKWSYGDIHIVKIPEWVEMCLDCSPKYRDNKTYTWKEWGWGVYKIWEWFIDKDE